MMNALFHRSITRESSDNEPRKSRRSSSKRPRTVFLIFLCGLFASLFVNARFHLAAVHNTNDTNDNNNDNNSLYTYPPKEDFVMLRPVTFLQPQDLKSCLKIFKPVHNTTRLHVATAKVSLSNTSLLLNQSLPQRCGTLRRTYWNYYKHDGTKRSTAFTLIEQIESHQTNCSAPAMRFDMDNAFGLGSHLVLWSQALCNAWEQGYRIQTYNPNWLWMDQAHCDKEESTHHSALQCYFPHAETSCVSPHPSQHTSELLDLPQVPDPRNQKLFCLRLANKTNLTALRQFRSASFGYLFRGIAPLVMREAERQLGLLFPDTAGRAPPDLIALHIRWGDKFWEMDLPSIQEYVDAIHHILKKRNATESNDTVSIYLATEDPRAVQAFRNATKHESRWRIHVDRTITELNAFRPTKGNRASWAARNTQGRAGLVALGSLLVAMEAHHFVLTTKSNWSRLMAALRQDMEGDSSDSQSIVVDLRPGDW